MKRQSCGLLVMRGSPDVSVSSWVALGQSLYFSEPQFPDPYKGYPGRAYITGLLQGLKNTYEAFSTSACGDQVLCKHWLPALLSMLRWVFYLPSPDCA